MHPRNQGKASPGFSLVEVLVVVAIVAILITICIPGYRIYAKRTYNSAAISDLKNITSGLEAYKSDHDGYPADLSYQ